jgi:hypothetical protein
MATDLKFLLTLEDQATNKLNEFRNTIDGVTNKQLKQAGAAMTGFGAATIGALALSGKAAADEEKAIKGLRQAITNTGEAYSEYKEGIKGAIDTGLDMAYADEDIYASLQALTEQTGSADVALKKLPLAMDLARAKGMDLASAAQLVGKVTQGNTAILSRYGITLAEGATATQVLAELQAKFGGQAKAYSDTSSASFDKLSITFDNLKESIGAVVLPVMEKFTTALTTLLDLWNKIPEPLQTAIVVIAGVAGAFAAVAGPILLFLGFIPQIIAGVATMSAVFTALAASTGPIFLVALAIAGLVAGGVLLVKHWDTVKGAASTAWNAIASAMKVPINAMIGYYEFWANAVIKAVNLIIGALNTINVSIPDWVPGIGGNGFGINLPSVSEVNIPRLASGGIVTRPTMALIGESGPEAVVPLGRGMGVNVTVNTMAVMGDESSIRQLARLIHGYIRDEERRTYGRAA